MWTKGLCDKAMHVRLKRSYWGVLVVWAATFGAALGGENYQYLGCYKDRADDRDLKEKEIPFSTLTVEDCVNQCSQDGWPYAGLQGGTTCFCGPLYNSHGEAALGGCNYTCTDTFECGGRLANSIYYSVKIDEATKLEREEYAHKTEMTFENARRTCIQNNGDVSTPRDVDAINATIALAVEAGVTSDKIWFGLQRPPTGWYVWTDKDATVLEREAYESYWYSDAERWQNPCVMLHVPTGKWESTSCHAKYPYVCQQIPPKDGDVDTDLVDVTEEEEEEGPSNTALYIVLPLFTFCYGGSCLIYCIGKLWQHCKKRKKRMLLEKDEENFTEFEPDTKPKPPPAAAPAKTVRPVHTPVQDFAELPTVTSQTKPMYYGVGQPAPVPKRGYTPATVKSPTDTRPATSQGVTLSVGTTPRSRTPADKQERRREKLLQNALKEARERKKDRESRMSSRPDTSMSFGSRPDSGAIINENDELPIPTKHKKKHKKRDTPDSGDSMTDLLGEDKKDDGAPQHMSIQDIMKVKMLMKDHVSKPRRIIAV